jgi:hypothetical protein
MKNRSMKTILPLIFVITSLCLQGQGSKEMDYSQHSALLDIERVDFFEVDLLYSCGNIYENWSSEGLISKTDTSGNLYWPKRIKL